MLQVLICDDDAVFARELRERAEEILSSLGVAARVLCFGSASEIGSETLASCDLALLDVDLEGGGSSGMELARDLRARNADVVIVFVTNYVEYAPEGYEVRAFRYILKSDAARRLPGCISDALEAMREENSSIRIQIGGELISLALRDVLYVESMGHTLIYHALKKGGAEESLSCYGAIGRAEEELRERGFIRIHKSYLANMAHIKRLGSSEAVLDSGVSLPVGAKNGAECRRQFLLWRGRKL